MHPAILKIYHFLFPRICPVCREDIPNSAVVSLCNSCMSQIRMAGSISTEGVNSPGASYFGFRLEGVGHRLLLTYKYGGKTYLGPTLVHLFLQNWTWNADAWDGIVPVPSRSIRDLRRGFSPPLLLAKELGRALGLPVFPHIIERPFWSPSQTKLNRIRRWENAKKAYVLTKRSQKLEAKRIILLDDVSTSGATLSMCAHLLREGGVAEVLGTAIAYDPDPNSTPF